MQRTDNIQINTKVYWNHIYTTPAKSQDYWADTRRFPKALEYVKDGDVFLDMGCGVGVLGREVKKRRKGCEIWGVDISDRVLEANKKDDPDIEYRQGYAGYCDFLPNNYFDVVFSGELIEHMDNPLELFKEAYRILKKGGKLIITTPIGKRVDSPEHMWYFDKNDIKNFFESAGFKKPKFVKLPDMEHLIVFFAVGEK